MNIITELERHLKVGAIADGKTLPQDDCEIHPI